MKRTTWLLTALLTVGVASADPITMWMNDFSTLDGVTTRDPVGDPYLFDGGVVADVPEGATGYAVFDIAMVPIDEGFPIANEGFGTIEVTFRWDTGFLPPADPTGFWMRVYSSDVDPNTGDWVFSGSQNYFFPVEADAGWVSFSRAVADWDETDGFGLPFNEESIYKFRFDSVVWDDIYTPYTFGIDHFALIQPECPRDLDGDDDVDLSDLAALLAEYGCSPEVTTLYDTTGFEGFNDGDIDGQDGWENVGSDSSGFVMDDPTGAGMGKVLKMDADTGLVAIQRLITTPVSQDIVLYEWDQYREDLGDNVWHCDDAMYDGWWSVQWDSSDPRVISAVGWPGAGSEIHAGVWEHVEFELNLTEGKARVAVDGAWSDVANFTTDDMKGIELEIEPTAVAGDGAIYYDNVKMSLRTICPIDYNGDGYTDLSDLAHLLGAYGCGTD